MIPRMTPMWFMLITFFSSIAAGLLGSLLGLGGGIIVIPVLTLLLGVDIRYAIGASIVSVIATSTGAAAAYVKEHLSNIRVAMWLELGTTAGALSGAYVGGILPRKWLFIVFSVVLGYTALMMLWKRRERRGEGVPASEWADRLRLHDHYYDEGERRVVHYRVGRPFFGMAVSYVAGIVRGLRGVGGGVLKVPAMDMGMRMPIKVSTATSNFMIGVTAAASAGVYFTRGQINPFIAGPVALGVLTGATLGSMLLGRLHGKVVRALFVIILLVTAAQMMWKGINVH